MLVDNNRILYNDAFHCNSAVWLYVTPQILMSWKTLSFVESLWPLVITPVLIDWDSFTKDYLDFEVSFLKTKLCVIVI